MKPLYIWAGGKNKMIPKYLVDPSIPTTGYDTYAEPFFGGGAMMCWVSQNCPNVTKFILNDINAEIIGIYRAIKSDHVNFMARMDALTLQYLPLSKIDRKAFYYDLRREYTTNWHQWNSTDESASLYFLMKTGFNGIWQTNQTSNGRFATPSGLLNQTVKVYDRDNVIEWHNFLQKVDITCGIWQNCTALKQGRTFWFFDPPYRDSFTSYSQTFTDQDHTNLITFCRQQDLAGDLVFYCNRECGDTFYTQQQGQLILKKYPITYTAGRRAKTVDENNNTTHTAKTAEEILLYSPSITPLRQAPRLLDQLFEFDN
jgi:DNA adenine methylase